MSEKHLEEQLKQYQELAKMDKKIDVAGLMIKALQDSENNHLPIKSKRWAYLLSISIPLVGFYYSFKYFNSHAEDAMEAGLACGILACFCLLSFFVIGHSMTAGSGLNFKDVENIKPADVYQLTQ
jgi:hypothetical protein